MKPSASDTGPPKPPKPSSRSAFVLTGKPIEDRILDLRKHKPALVKALLSEETTSLRIDSETLSHLLEPLAVRSVRKR